jgi:hypothetical protein
MAPALKDAVEDRLGEIPIVEDPTPGGQGLVRREDHFRPSWSSTRWAT